MNAPPDFITPVIGYRTWNHREGKLISPYREHNWSRGINRAECRSSSPRFEHPHSAPACACDCGLHAYHKPWRAWQVAPYEIVGAVLMWGRIEVHYSGLRAEYCQPLLLGTHPDYPAPHCITIAALADTYRIPTIHLGDLEARAATFGADVPADHFPTRVTTLS